MIRLVNELLEIIEHQTDLLNKKDELISKLVNENLEKENYISVLGKEIAP